MLAIKVIGERAMVDSRCLSAPDSVEILADISRWFGVRSPEAIAISYGAQHTTYRELDRYANQVANGLIAAGIKPGGRSQSSTRTAIGFSSFCSAPRKRARFSSR